MKRLVLFDIGGVLLKLYIPEFFKTLADRSPKAADGAAVRELFQKSGVEDEYHDGKLSEESFLRKLKKLFVLTESIDKIGEIYRDRLGGPIAETIDLKKRLAESGITVGLLSNTSREDTLYLSEKYPEIYETFGGPKIFSFEVGASKPNPIIYEIVPECKDITFIEDTPRNLEIPKQRGWKTFIYPDQSNKILSLVGA